MLRMLSLAAILMLTNTAWALDVSYVIDAVLLDKKLPLIGHERDDEVDTWRVKNSNATFERYPDKKAWMLSLDGLKEIPQALLSRMKIVCHVDHDRELGAYSEIYKLEAGKYAGGLVLVIKHPTHVEYGYSVFIESPLYVALGQSRPGNPAIKLPDDCRPHH